MKSRFGVFLLVPAVLLLVAGLSWSTAKIEAKSTQSRNEAEDNASRLIEQGRQIFRFDTFGDEVFWSDQLQMQRSVMSLSPQTALALGLKVDSDALPASVIEAIRHGKVNLNDPAHLAADQAERCVTHRAALSFPSIEFVHGIQHGNDVFDWSRRLQVMNGIENESPSWREYLTSAQDLFADLGRVSERQHSLGVDSSAPKCQLASKCPFQLLRLHTGSGTLHGIEDVESSFDKRW